MLVIVLVVVIDSLDVRTKHPSLVFVHVREQRPAFEQQRSKFDNEHDDEHEHDSGTKGRLFWGGDRGRDKGRLCPSLRTGLPNFLDPALQLVVNFQEDRHAAVCACFKENKPTAEK